LWIVRAWRADLEALQVPRMAEGFVALAGDFADHLDEGQLSSWERWEKVEEGDVEDCADEADGRLVSVLEAARGWRRF